MNDTIWAMYVYNRRTGDLVDAMAPQDTSREAQIAMISHAANWYESFDFIWRFRMWVTSGETPSRPYHHRVGRRHGETTG